MINGVSNEFDDLIYFEIGFNQPNGWEKQEERRARKSVDRGVGGQSNVATHLKTGHMKNKKTRFDEDGNVIDTADFAIYRTDESAGQIIAKAENAMSAEIGKPLSAIREHSAIVILGGQQEMLDHIAANKARYGEQI